MPQPEPPPRFEARPLGALALVAALALGSAPAASAAEFTRIDPAASEITFAYTQMGVNMDGRFTRFDAQIAFDPAAPEQGRAVLELPLAAIDVGFADANSEVQDKAWFDAAHFPVARFESSRITALGDNRFELAGMLTLKGTSHPISAPVTWTGQGTRAVFEGSFSLQRADYAIGEGQWSDFRLVANEVRVRFRITALQP